jgi:hypothetical protein
MGADHRKRGPGRARRRDRGRFSDEDGIRIQMSRGMDGYDGSFIH